MVQACHASVFWCFCLSSSPRFAPEDSWAGTPDCLLQIWIWHCQTSIMALNATVSQQWQALLFLRQPTIHSPMRGGARTAALSTCASGTHVRTKFQHICACNIYRMLSAPAYPYLNRVYPNEILPLIPAAHHLLSTLHMHNPKARIKRTSTDEQATTRQDLGSGLRTQSITMPHATMQQ